MTLKLFRKTKEIGDKQKLQDDIDKLVRWSEKWQMLFNFGKCKCLHTGPGNTGMNYEMGGTILSKTVKEKDLGVSMNANMKVSEQCRIEASKGNQVLGMIRRNITYKEKSLIVPLYKAIVRPHLEYCIQAWIPYLRKDIDMLEKIQRRATKLIPGLRDLRYEERLKECGLTTLETRRVRGDQIEVFNPLRLQYVILRTKSQNRCDYCTYIYVHGLCDRNMGLLPASKRHFTVSPHEVFT